MEEKKRQKQVAGLVQKEMNEIFQRIGLTMLNGGMISISAVKVTPDLLEARIYISLFQVTDREGTMKKIEERAWEIKKDFRSGNQTKVNVNRPIDQFRVILFH